MYCFPGTRRQKENSSKHESIRVTVKRRQQVFLSVYIVLALETRVKMSHDELLGPCGLNCGWCPFYIKGSPQLKCGGCWSREKCGIRDCAKNKGLKICTYCQEFPCKKLYEMYGKMNDFFDEMKKAFPKGIKP
jgi:hypothetical protein